MINPTAISVDHRNWMLGRVARPAASGQRLPGPLSGHHPAVQLHRRLVLGDGVRGLRHAAAVLRDAEPPEPGLRGAPAQISAVIDHPNVANPVTFTTVIPNSGIPSRSAPTSAQPGLQPRPTPMASSARCRTTWSTCSAHAAHGFANRPFDNSASSTAWRPADRRPHPAAVRRPQRPPRWPRHQRRRVRPPAQPT